MRSTNGFWSQECTVSVYAGDAKSVEGVVLELDLKGDDGWALIEFPNSDALALPICDTVGLVFSGGELGTSVGGRGIIEFRSRNRVSSRCKFRLSEEVRAGLDRVINRRYSSRVRPDADALVRVVLHTDERKSAEVETHVNDMSATGVSLLLSPDDEKKLFSLWELGLSLYLPGESAAVNLRGVVQYRRLSGSAIHYGIEFDFKNTPESSRVRESVVAYVMERQAEMKAEE